ncbi:Zn(2)-C6 fungal-type domain-containing protein [Mycena indigotica]|uniref:Zn(2)-C6 fungal-type domain-containing protein n=1 Tax=Mycena indigotica TaxID=2126181 RepID=A0A8H6SU99_9AGAR|nr:Zn(2)-C6 fungal-type domain-containing protein [Mycena indigotica]KAF7304045.1 Zn(2)-C6 fungal-type domain-containing protein [Mycena indigotica]
MPQPTYFVPATGSWAPAPLANPYAHKREDTGTTDRWGTRILEEPTATSSAPSPTDSAWNRSWPHFDPASFNAEHYHETRYLPTGLVASSLPTYGTSPLVLPAWSNDRFAANMSCRRRQGVDLASPPDTTSYSLNGYLPDGPNIVSYSPPPHVPSPRFSEADEHLQITSAQRSPATACDEANVKPVRDRRQPLSCLFCRARKIACGTGGRFDERRDSEPEMCWQCLKRGRRVCIYPAASKRGLRHRVENEGLSGDRIRRMAPNEGVSPGELDAEEYRICFRR